MALVIRTWRLSATPADGFFVVIEGREAGLVSWLLTRFGLDTTTVLKINRDTVYFEQGSLEGYTQRVIPMSRMSSAYFGYRKPWKEALVFGLVLLPACGLGLIVGPLYYIMNKTTAIGVVESSGLVSSLEFKRSVIEGKDITEAEGRKLIDGIRALMEASTRRPAEATQARAAAPRA